MKEQRKSPRWGLWLVVGLVLLVTYPLSAPPITRLIREGYLPASIRMFTHPAYVSAKQFPLNVRKVYFDYWLWWNPPMWRGE